ncbi:MAG: hypothetical protein ACKOAH_04015, partial [Pirellula sp.]
MTNPKTLENNYNTFSPLGYFSSITRPTRRLSKMRFQGFAVNKNDLSKRIKQGLIAGVLGVCGWSSIGHAEDGDWAQWRGPARDGIAGKQSLLQTWPEGGPKLAWTYPAAGVGYSSSAIS